VNRSSLGSSFGLGVGVALSCVSLVAAQPATGGAEADDATDDVTTSESVAGQTAIAAGGVSVPVPPRTPATAINMGDVVTEPSVFTWEPFGYLRLQYVVVQNDPNVAHIGRGDGFELQNARIGVRGHYGERVRYAVAIDGAVDERVLPNTPQGTLRVGLRDAFGDVVLGGRVFVRAGFFQTWTDPQRLVPDTVREFVDRPIESRGVRSTQGWFAEGLPPGRSIGAAIRLEPEQAGDVGFEVAVQNGSDEFSSSNDSDLPAVSVAAQYQLSERGFIVASGRWAPRVVGDLPFRQDETDLQGALGAQINTGVIRLGAAGIVQRTSFQSTGGPVENSFGAHAQLVVRLSSGDTPVYAGYRFGILDPSSLIVTDRVMEHTVVGVVAVPSLRMRLQMQLTHVMEQAARELSNSRVQLAAELAL
jgi:hypothetical protein